jgi:protease-4
MSDIAASGGYYISFNAEAIVAQPGTRTGAIGVWGLRPSFKGLLKKIGINTVTVHRGRNALIDSMTTDSTQEWADLLQRSIEYDYNMFITKVAAGRKMTKEAVDKVGRGRVWTGELAHKIGLVDKLGGFPEAVALINEKLGRAKDADVELTWARKRKGLWEMIKEATDQGPGVDPIPLFSELPTDSLRYALWHPGTVMMMEPNAK